jgi:hypothetical protein
MRYTALVGCVLALAACTKKEAPPAADTMAVAPAAPAMSMASVAGMWNVNVMPVGKDTVVTSYVLNATDTTNWRFVFTGRTDTIPMRVTGMSGDTLISEAGPFPSSLRKGQQVSITTKSWLQDGKLMSSVAARYPGNDSTIMLRGEGTKQ